MSLSGIHEDFFNVSKRLASSDLLLYGQHVLGVVEITSWV